MRIEHLLDLAEQHVEVTKASQKVQDATPPAACLSDEDVLRITKLVDDNDDDEAASANLESILGIFFNPTDHRRSIRRHAEVIALEAWLRKPGRRLNVNMMDSDSLSSHSTARKITNRFRQAIIDTILPTQPWAERLQSFGVEKTAAGVNDEDDVARLGSMNVVGLSVLSHLERIDPSSFGIQEEKDLVEEEDEERQTLALISCLASFTDPREEWSSQEASQLAHSLLNSLLPRFNAVEQKRGSRSFITLLLELRVKPLFARTTQQNSAITSQGRKAIDGSAPSNYHLMSGDPEGREAKPWRFHHVYVLTMFRFILESIQTTSIEAHWPLLIPPLLALVDDTSTPFKVRGCSLLAVFLAKVPSPLLERTGLGEVFENALMPGLLHLPSLTPEHESRVILEATYGTLLVLNRRLFSGAKHRARRLRALDAVMRDGILRGYAHAGDGHVRIAELLVRKMTDLVHEMGVDSAKHLKMVKHIIPLLSHIMSAPFATAYPPLLTASVHAIDAVVVNVWPRVAYHRGEILEGLVICWGRIHGEEAPSRELEGIQTHIHRTVKLVTAILKTDMDVTEEYQRLIDADHRLQQLLLV
ncbi:hypothetical protein MMC07_002041 [Pseudocyphellaria aurata]|nr:hypothetical protein [Pseudocyphellaria aurata]